MEYKVTLHNGQGFNITVKDGQTIEALTIQLNDRATSFVNLGGCVVHKNTVATILPIKEQE